MTLVRATATRVAPTTRNRDNGEGLQSLASVCVSPGIGRIADMEWQYNDGGRAAAGYKGSTGDCVTRAIAISTGKPYREVYDALNEFSKRERRTRGRSSARTGVHKATYSKYLDVLGWRWTPTMQIGQGCRVHLRADELPGGRLIVSVSRHVCAVIDGVVYDTDDPRREGTRCVYGYWSLD